MISSNIDVPPQVYSQRSQRSQLLAWASSIPAIAASFGLAAKGSERPSLSTVPWEKRGEEHGVSFDLPLKSRNVAVKWPASESFTFGNHISNNCDHENWIG